MKRWSLGVLLRKYNQGLIVKFIVWRPVPRFCIFVRLQGNLRALQTDRWLAVRGSDSIFALGDAATIALDRALEHAAELFVQARSSTTHCVLYASLHLTRPCARREMVTTSVPLCGAHRGAVHAGRRGAIMQAR